MNAPIDISNVILETERLILRPFTYDDLDDFYEYASVPGVGEMAGWKHHESKEESLKILTSFVTKKKTFALVYKENNKVIGSLGIEEYGAEDKLSEFYNYSGRSIGFVLAKDYWGKGLMPEAVNKVIDYLFSVLNLDFLLCSHFVYNERSKRVQHKCGFVPYRKVVYETMMGTKEDDIVNLLINPSKDIKFEYSHPETLLIK